jgi:hypothetical protein
MKTVYTTYTDGSKNEEGTGAGIAIYINRSLRTKLNTD